MSDKILVLNDPSCRRVVDGLGDIVISYKAFMEKPDEYKLVLFTGGEDVDPSLYNDSSPLGYCRSNILRDKLEMRVFETALKNNIKMAGICRGLQFLNVMAGGKLMHHISNHGGSVHYMETITGQYIRVNSLHHQMILLPGDKTTAISIGWGSNVRSTIYLGENDKKVEYKGKEHEAAIFTDILSFGVQYHPEIISNKYEAYMYFRNMIENAIKLPWKKFVKAYSEKDSNIVDFFGRKQCYQDK